MNALIKKIESITPCMFATSFGKGSAGYTEALRADAVKKIDLDRKECSYSVMYNVNNALAVALSVNETPYEVGVGAVVDGVCVFLTFNQIDAFVSNTNRTYDDLDTGFENALNDKYLHKIYIQSATNMLDMYAETEFDSMTVEQLIDIGRVLHSPVEISGDDVPLITGIEMKRAVLKYDHAEHVWVCDEANPQVRVKASVITGLPVFDGRRRLNCTSTSFFLTVRDFQ